MPDCCLKVASAIVDAVPMHKTRASSPRPKTIIVLLTAVLTATAAGCGDQAPTTVAATVVSPTASATPVAPPASPEAAAAAAERINLLAADVPGFTAMAADADAASDSASSEFDVMACLGLRLPVTPEHASDAFTRESETAMTSVSSAVQVLPSAQQLQQELAALQSAGALDCMYEYARTTFARVEQRNRLSIMTPEVVRLPMSSPDSFGFRMTTSLYGNGIKLPVVTDYVGVGKGRMAVALITGGVNSAFPDAQRDALLAKLAERATAHGI